MKPPREESMPLYHRAPFLTLYFFWFMLMMCQKILFSLCWLFADNYRFQSFSYNVPNIKYVLNHDLKVLEKLVLEMTVKTKPISNKGIVSYPYIKCLLSQIPILKIVDYNWFYQIKNWECFSVRTFADLSISITLLKGHTNV